MEIKKKFNLMKAILGILLFSIFSINFVSGAEGDFKGNITISQPVSDPTGVCFDDNYFYIMDTGSEILRRYYHNGTYKDDLISGTTNAQGCDVANGIIYITDYNPQLIRTYYVNGTSIGSFSSGVGVSPMTLNSDGTELWLSQYGTKTIRRYYINGTFITSFTLSGGVSDYPSGITMDENYLWVTSTTDDEMYKYYHNGTYTGTHWDTATYGNDFGWGVDIYEENFYVTDRTDDVLYIYEYADIIPPNISITYPVNATHYGSNVTHLDYFVEDDGVLDTCWYSLDLGVTNTSITCGQNVTGLNIGDGNYTWMVFANDSFGNENSDEVYFVVDNITPVLTWYYPTLSQNLTLSVNSTSINVSAYDPYLDATNITVYNESGDVIYTNFTGNLTIETFWMEDTIPLDLGDNILEICARDSLTESPKIKDKAQDKFIKIDEENTDFELPSGEKITRTFELYDSDDKKLKAEDYNLATEDIWTYDEKHYKTTWNLDNLPDGSYFVIKLKYQHEGTLKLLSDRGVIRIIDDEYNYVWKFNDLIDAGFDVYFQENPQNKKIEVLVRQGDYVPTGTHWTLDPIVAGLNTICGNETITYEIPVPPPSEYIEGEGAIYEVMRSSGAGLGKLFIYLGASIPLLFIGIAFVVGIIGVGRAIVDVLRVGRG